MKTMFLLASVPALATLSPAQFLPQDGVQDLVRAPDRAPVALGAWHVPFSTDEAGSAWAAGPDYKVAVDDGMTFYPVLGSERPENLPWRWTTTSIRRGDAVLASEDAPSTLRASEFRAEIDRGLTVEVYDARQDGVEQLFVLHPGTAGFTGDLEIVGRVTTDLVSAPAAEQQQSLEFFAADGQHILTFGAALAFDALGRTCAMTTRFDGEGITLRLDGGWLSNAAFPVTVDPLVSRAELGTSTTAYVDYPQVVRSATQDRLFVSETRFSSGVDADLIVRAYTDNWHPLTTVFSALGGTSSARRASLAVAEGADKWVVAYESASFVTRAVRYYVHDAGDLTLNSGTSTPFPMPANTHGATPSVGGSGGDYVFIAVRQDIGQFSTDSAQSRIYGMTLDADNLSVVSGPDDLQTVGGSNYDSARPQVSNFSESSGWLVVWQSYNYDNAGDDWDIIAQRISAGGALSGGAVFGNDLTSSQHKLTPKVAGSGSRYAIAFVNRANDGTKTTEEAGASIRFHQITWSIGQQPIEHTLDVLVSSSSDDFLLATDARSMAYDHRSDSHWGLAWKNVDTGELAMTRIGFDSKKAETVTLEPGNLRTVHGEPSICFDEEGFSFPVVYAGDDSISNRPVYGNRLDHGDASAIPQGASCPGIVSSANHGSGGAPFAGSQYFEVKLESAQVNAPSVFVIGFAPGNVPLPGTTGCALLLDLNLPLINAAYAFTDAMGNWDVQIPIPSTTPDSTIYAQFIQLWNGGLYSSNRLEINVR